MKTSAVNKKQTLTNEEKEIFFQQLENNNEFFNEAIENILTLIVSDPVLTFQVADLIESEYRNLFLIIAKKQTQENKDDTSGCCSTH